MPRRGGLSSLANALRAWRKTTMFSEKTRRAKGMNCSAISRRTTRGSAAASTFANAITNAGGSMLCIASAKSARFDAT
jgi:hypothetical protein